MKSAEPSGLSAGFAAFFREFVQLLLQVRFFLLQILDLAVAVVDVSDIVLHSSGDIEAAASVFLDVIFQLLNRLIGRGDILENRLGPAAPILLAVWIVVSLGIGGSRAAGTLLVFFADDGNAALVNSGEVVFGVNLFGLGLVFLALFRGIRHGFFLRLRGSLRLRRRRLRRRRLLWRRGGLRERRAQRPSEEQKNAGEGSKDFAHSRAPSLPSTTETLRR